ncbi:MAG TPA: hypothetical protein VEC99_07805 [Clostridia bacterium]|nr:hypothetical protein [Clostridia bacterium]
MQLPDWLHGPGVIIRPDLFFTRYFGYKVPLSEYDIVKERFRVVVPETYSTNSSWGLFVWISPGNEAHSKFDVAPLCWYKPANDFSSRY